MTQIPCILFTNSENREHSESGLAKIPKPRDEFSEAEIEELILEHNLYDESLYGLVVDCHGKTPLHYSIIEKHENIINCFKEYDGMMVVDRSMCISPYSIGIRPGDSASFEASIMKNGAIFENLLNFLTVLTRNSRRYH